MLNRSYRASLALAGMAALAAGLLVPACARSKLRTRPAGPVRPEAPLRIPLPQTIPVGMVVYFRPAGGPLPDAKTLEARVVRWVDGHATDPARDVLQHYLRHGLLLMKVKEKNARGALPVEMLRRMGAGDEELRRYQEATHEVLVGGGDAPGPPHFGLWCGIAAARAVAAAVSGVILDPALPRLEPIASDHQPIPKDLRIRLRDQIVVPFSVGENGLGWITTNGLGKFGLPDLQIRDIPPNLHDNLGWVMNGAARHLLVELAKQSRGRQAARVLRIGPEIRLTVQELTGEGEKASFHRYQGARGWTRIRLRYEPARQGETGFLTLLPPRGFRGSQGVWLNALLTDLFGSEETLRLVGADSQAMEAAHQRAVRELPGVKRRFQAGLRPGETLLVKYGFPTGDGGHEYMWVAVDTWKGGHLRGNLANDPELRRDLRAGQTIDLAEQDVFDWMIQLPKGGTEGGYTTTVVKQEGRKSGQ
jgi:uncharacterized protein YegJ (DUF2314 family)